MIFNFGLGILSTLDCRRLLGVHQANARKGPLVAKVGFVCVVPIVDVFDDRQPTAIDDLGVELDEPGTKTLCNSIRHPEPDFVT